MISALDMVAAFDRADHQYMQQLFRHLNLGIRVENLMKAIFSNMFIAVGVNGARTKFFKQTRAIRQGDPVAMATFVMSVEPLANLIRRDSQLCPVRIPNQGPKSVVQYCDDTTILSESAGDFGRIRNITKVFERGSGARLNHEKTEILLLGDWNQRELSEIPQNNIKDSVKILGVWFGKNATELNQQMILNKIDKIIDFWKDIPLSFDGKILIINTKILSQLYHVIRITGMSTQLKNEVQKRVTRFFWFPRKMYLISYNTLQNSKQYGGLDLPNIDNINSAILAERIAKILFDNKPWKGYFTYRLGFTLRSLNFNFASPGYAHTNKQTAVTTIIANTYRALNNNIIDWSKETFKSLKSRLHKNAPVRTRKQRDYSDTWAVISETTKNRKIRDMCHLIAHEALPVADILIRRGLRRENKCRLCGNLNETLNHLFMDCTMVRELKQLMESQMNWLRTRTLGEEEILYHEGRVKMRKKARTLIGNYKHSIWITRALCFYGKIETTPEIKAKMTHLYNSKCK